MLMEKKKKKKKHQNLLTSPAPCSSTLTLPTSDETTEPLQRCVPGPGACVDWERRVVFWKKRKRLSSFRRSSRRNRQNHFALSFFSGYLFVLFKCVRTNKSSRRRRGKHEERTSGKRTSPGVAMIAGIKKRKRENLSRE